MNPDDSSTHRRRWSEWQAPADDHRRPRGDRHQQHDERQAEGDEERRQRQDPADQNRPSRLPLRRRSTTRIGAAGSSAPLKGGKRSVRAARRVSSRRLRDIAASRAGMPGVRPALSQTGSRRPSLPGSRPPPAAPPPARSTRGAAPAPPGRPLSAVTRAGRGRQPAPWGRGHGPEQPAAGHPSVRAGRRPPPHPRWSACR